MNTANGLTVIYDTLKQLNQNLRAPKDEKLITSLYNALNMMLHVYGLDKKLTRMDAETKALYNKWAEARSNKDFALADTLREELKSKGINL